MFSLCLNHRQILVLFPQISFVLLSSSFCSTSSLTPCWQNTKKHMSVLFCQCMSIVRHKGVDGTKMFSSHSPPWFDSTAYIFLLFYSVLKGSTRIKIKFSKKCIGICFPLCFVTKMFFVGLQSYKLDIQDAIIEIKHWL